MIYFLTCLVALPLTLLLVSVCFDVLMTFAAAGVFFLLAFWLCELIYRGFKKITAIFKGGKNEENN